MNRYEKKFEGDAIGRHFRVCPVLKFVALNLALAGLASGEPYNPNFLMNAGFGFYSFGDNAVEVSEWFNISKSTGWYFGGGKSALWIGFDQGYYLSESDKVGYFEIQAAATPAGLSAGIIKKEAGPNEWKGSLWFSVPFLINFTGSLGFETFDHGKRSKVNFGAFFKVPIYACCGVFDMP